MLEMRRVATGGVIYTRDGRDANAMRCVSKANGNMRG